MTWKPIRACDPWDARTKLNLLRCSGHMQTGGVRVFYGDSTVLRQCFGEGVARTRKVTVRCMYGSIRCMCEHRTDTYVLENTRRILRSLYMARTCPGDGCECTYEFLAPYDCLRAFYGEKKCACTTFRHRLLTGIRGLYGLKKPVELRVGPYDHPRVTGMLALTVPVNYPGAPCDLGISVQPAIAASIRTQINTRLATWLIIYILSDKK